MGRILEAAKFRKAAETCVLALLQVWFCLFSLWKSFRADVCIVRSAVPGKQDVVSIPGVSQKSELDVSAVVFSADLPHLNETTHWMTFSHL